MQGETELAILLRDLTPVMDVTEYVFVCVEKVAQMLPVQDQVRGMFVETEGVTLILPVAIAAQQGWRYDGRYRCITCNVHSSLDAVGMTAAMSAVLTEAGISANVVAAFYHDHLFVPVNDAEAALDALRALSAS